MAIVFFVNPPPDFYFFDKDVWLESHLPYRLKGSIEVDEQEIQARIKTLEEEQNKFLARRPSGVSRESHEIEALFLYGSVIADAKTAIGNSRERRQILEEPRKHLAEVKVSHYQKISIDIIVLLLLYIVLPAVVLYVIFYAIAWVKEGFRSSIQEKERY